jgi:hypothetical protein
MMIVYIGFFRIVRRGLNIREGNGDNGWPSSGPELLLSRECP